MSVQIPVTENQRRKNVRRVANPAYPVEMIVNLAVFLSLRLLMLTIRQILFKIGDDRTSSQ
jgi:hypothetical protein